MAEQEGGLVRAEALRAFAERALSAVGMRPPDAAIVADGMVWCDLRGIEPHGVAKLPVCIARFEAGGSLAGAVPTVVQETATTAVLDAGAAWGQLAATRAMELAIERAGRQQVGVVVVRNSSSLGALGYYPLLAAHRDLIGLTITNSMPLLAPWGGATKLLGNQAYAIACPAGAHPPVLLDTSNGATSWGRIVIAAEKGEQLAPGLALDRDGRPTIDPAEAARGLLQPVGGHKGYGLALMWELLTGVLAGLAYGPNVGPLEPAEGRQEVSHFVLALDPAAFLPLDRFKARVDDLIDQIHAVPPAPGVERVLVPGERGFRLAAERERSGIPLPARRVAELARLAERLSLRPLELA